MVARKALAGVLLVGAGAGAGAAVAVAVARASRRRAGRAPAAADVARLTGVADLLRLPDGVSTTVTTSDGASLAVTIAGDPDGPTVVMAHGWTEVRGLWSLVAQRLIATGHRVVVYDQRGHGESTMGSGPVTMSRLGEDLGAVLVSLTLHEAVLVGHSMGGMSVMALIGDAPDLVAGHAAAVVLVSTAAHGLFIPNARVNDAAARLAGSGTVTRVMAGRAGPRLARGGLGRSPAPVHVQATATMFANAAGRVRGECVTAMAAMDLRAGLALCPVPATVVVGSRDQLTPPRLAKVIVARIAGARLIVIPDAGHMIPFEAPDRLAEIITEAGAEAGAGAGGPVVAVPVGHGNRSGT